MKVLARILLFIFIAFLITPTIVQVLKKDNSAALSLNFSEEEEAYKEFKATVHPFILEHEVPLLVWIQKKMIISENIVELDNISPSIFAPPPNLA
jgi:hypothetical protein